MCGNWRRAVVGVRTKSTRNQRLTETLPPTKLLMNPTISDYFAKKTGAGGATWAENSGFKSAVDSN